MKDSFWDSFWVFFLKDKLQFHLAILFNEAVEVSSFWAKFDAKRARYLINFICFLNAQVYGSYLSYNLKGGIFNAKVFLIEVGIYWNLSF